MSVRLEERERDKQTVSKLVLSTGTVMLEERQTDRQ